MTKHVHDRIVTVAVVGIGGQGTILARSYHKMVDAHVKYYCDR